MIFRNCVVQFVYLPYFNFFLKMWQINEFGLITFAAPDLSKIFTDDYDD